MLHPMTLDRLRSFRLSGFIDALATQSELPQYCELPFDERLTLLIDAEHSRRCQTRTERLVREARLSNAATLTDVDFSVSRGLSRDKFIDLCQGSWLASGHNVIITGPTGVGKTFLASTIAHSLCAKGTSVRFQRTHQWLADFLLLSERRRLTQTIANWRRVPLLVFDEWMRDPISTADARFLLDLIDDRYRRLSCLFVAQIPVANWHSRFEDPTLADAILDRIAHHSIRLELSGESMRRILSKQPNEGDASLRSEI